MGSSAAALRVPRFWERTRDGDPMGTDAKDNWVSQIYQSYGADLKRFLTRRLGNQAAAEDIAQETYLQLHRPEQAQVRHPRALLFVMTSNLATKYQQRGAAMQG